MPIRYIIPNTIWAHNTEPRATLQNANHAPEGFVKINNESATKHKTVAHPDKDPTKVVIITPEGNFNVPVEAWSVAHIYIKASSFGGTRVQFAYREDNPEELIAITSEYRDFDNIEIVDQTLLTEKDLIPGEKYAFTDATIDCYANRLGLEYVGKFANDPDQRHVFLAGSTLFQVKSGLEYVKVATSEKPTLTAPRRQQMLTVMRKWADASWDGTLDHYTDDYNVRKSAAVEATFKEDHFVSKMASRLCYYRSFSTDTPTRHRYFYPMQWRFGKSRNLEITLSTAEQALRDKFPLQRSVPVAHEDGMDLSEWRSLFIEVYTMSMPENATPDWRFGGTQIVNDAYLSLTDIK